MCVVERGDTVEIHYVGKLVDGNIFDTSMKDVAKEASIYSNSKNYSPFEFIVGSGKAIKGIDEAVIGMKENEVKEITVPPDKAYGITGEHPMSGKTLIFKIKIIGIYKRYDDVRVPV